MALSFFLGAIGRRKTPVFRRAMATKQSSGRRAPYVCRIASLRVKPDGIHAKSDSRYCSSSSVGPLSFSFCAKRGKENPSQGKENPSQGKENPSQGKENPSSVLPRIEPFQRVAPAPHAIVTPNVVMPAQAGIQGS